MPGLTVFNSSNMYFHIGVVWIKATYSRLPYALKCTGTGLLRSTDN